MVQYKTLICYCFWVVGRSNTYIYYIYTEIIIYWHKIKAAGPLSVSYSSFKGITNQHLDVLSRYSPKKECTILTEQGYHIL